jgi:peptidoglycan/LPS O-acetylase OafA/YrhL
MDGPSPRRIFLPALTGVRGLAALWVLSFHIATFVPIGPVPLLKMGYVGVDVFFVLSGFIIGHVHLDDFAEVTLAGIRRFLALRLSRIYPVHLAMLLAATLFAVVLYAAGVPVLDNERFYPPQFLANLLLVQAWASGDHQSFNIVAWSISAEWLAYLAFPLLAFAANRMSGRTALVVGVAAIAVEAAVLALASARGNVGSSYAPVRVGGEFLPACAAMCCSAGRPCADCAGTPSPTWPASACSWPSAPARRWRRCRSSRSSCSASPTAAARSPASPRDGSRCISGTSPTRFTWFTCWPWRSCSRR